MIIPSGYPADPCYYKEWPVQSMPATLYVEGISTSLPRFDKVSLSYKRDSATIHTDTVNFTVLEVELFRDSSYSQVLDDWPKDGDHPRSPKYIFGEDDPIYVQVKNLGTDPYTAEPFFNFVKVTSASSESAYPPEPTCVHLDLQETGVNTQIFRNSEAASELLYLSTSSSENGRENIKVIDEEVLTFWMEIQPDSGNYVTCKTVMVDRAEIGTEFQEDYHIHCEHPNPPYCYLHTERFGGQLHDNIGGEPNLVWYKNFRNKDLASKQEHWHADSDTPYADSVDFASWSGHCKWLPGPKHALHFFNDSPTCDIFPRASTNLGDNDADWVIFDTCYSLWGLKDDLKTELLTSGRCAHMFLGFDSSAYWNYTNCGEYFAQRLKVTTIQQAWFDYCDNRQPAGCKVRVFRVPAYADESLAGPGPIEVKRDPIASDDWKIKAHVKP